MSGSKRWMLYGATGFTGRLLAEEAVRRGLEPVLAGRSADKLAPLAKRLKLPFVAISLEDGPALRKALDGMAAVVHAAGPFLVTADPMRFACLDVGAHYLDITGELPVFEDGFALDTTARQRGVSLISGLGFDVIPTDCLAAHVASKLKSVQSLDLAIAAAGTPSPGTAKSALGMVAVGGHIRRNGVLQPFPLGQGVRRVRFSQREAWVVPVPLADLSTAFHTTGARDITTFLAIPERIAMFLRIPVAAATSGIAAQFLLSSQRIRQRLAKQLEQRAELSADRPSRSGHSFVWAHAVAPDGTEAEAWLETPEAYDFSAVAAVRALEVVLKTSPVGALSPAKALGADFVLQIEGTRRFDTVPVIR